MIVKDWCSFCGECAGVCPRNLIQVKEYSLVFDACPINALEKED